MTKYDELLHMINKHNNHLIIESGDENIDTEIFNLVFESAESDNATLRKANQLIREINNDIKNAKKSKDLGEMKSISEGIDELIGVLKDYRTQIKYDDYQQFDELYRKMDMTSKIFNAVVSIVPVAILTAGTIAGIRGLKNGTLIKSSDLNEYKEVVKEHSKLKKVASVAGTAASVTAGAASFIKNQDRQKGIGQSYDKIMYQFKEAILELEKINKKLKKDIEKGIAKQNKTVSDVVKESVGEPEFEEGKTLVSEDIITEAAPNDDDDRLDFYRKSAKSVGVSVLKGIALAGIISALSKLLSMIIKSKKALKNNKDTDNSTKAKTEALIKLLDDEIKQAENHFITLNNSKKEFTKLFNALIRASNEEEFDKIKKDILSLESDMDKAFSSLCNIFENASKKVEDYARTINDDNHPAWTVIQYFDEELAQIDKDWTEVTEYFRVFKSTSYKDLYVKESDSNEELCLSITESFINNEITDDEYDILMSSL